MNRFVVANADGRVVTPVSSDGQGNPIFNRSNGAGFILVVEGQPGTSGSPVGQHLFLSDENDPTLRPDLQMLVDMNLGDGSAVVCDRGGQPTPGATPPEAGGVPAQPLTFGPSQATANAMNDLSCRFDVHDSSDRACTLNANGNFAFVGVGTTLQFCTAPVVGREIVFPKGNTTVSVQLMDVAGHIGDRRTIIVHVN